MSHVLELLQAVGSFVCRQVGQGSTVRMLELLVSASQLRFVLPEHVHTTFALVDNVHFVEKIVPDLGVADLQGLYDLPDSRHGGSDAGFEESRVRASVENVGVLAQRLSLGPALEDSLSCPTRHY